MLVSSRLRNQKASEAVLRGSAFLIHCVHGMDVSGCRAPSLAQELQVQCEEVPNPSCSCKRPPLESVEKRSDARGRNFSENTVGGLRSGQGIREQNIASTSVLYNPVYCGGSSTVGP